MKSGGADPNVVALSDRLQTQTTRAWPGRIGSKPATSASPGSAAAIRPPSLAGPRSATTAAKHGFAGHTLKIDELGVSGALTSLRNPALTASAGRADHEAIMSSRPASDRPYPSAPVGRPSRSPAAWITGGLWGAFWGGVAALHGFLFFRRLVAGELNAGLDQVRLLLAFAGSLYGVYGAARVGNAMASFHASPRRVAGWALILLLGHLWLHRGPSEPLAGSSPMATLDPIVFAWPAILLLTLGLTVATPAAKTTHHRLVPAHAVRLHDRPHGARPAWIFPPLFNRPPPAKT